MRHLGVGIMLEGKADRPRGRPSRGLTVHHTPLPPHCCPSWPLAIPVWFLARPQLFTRSIPLPAGRDIRVVSR
jgi:hypothetical protein